MRRVTLGAALAVLIAAPTFAAISIVDTDGDNLATFDEMIVVYPNLTEETFGEIDLNADGFLDDAEMTAALEAQKIVAPAE